MKKLRYTITAQPDNQEEISLYEEIMTAVMSGVENLVCRYRYLVPNGWSCIIHVRTPSKTNVHLTLQSNAGGGTYAQAKMNMLKGFETKRYASGGETISELVNILHELDESEERNDLICKISKLETVSQVPDGLADYMNEHFHVAPYYGAVAIPYEVLYGKLGSSDDPQTGEIRISFSGASQEQDVMFATWIFRELQQKMVTNLCTEQLWFNLRHLEKIPNVQLWIDLLDIQESLCP